MSRVSSIFKAGLFENRVAVVTGGATGIGRAITDELIHLGCKVVIAARKQERLDQACADIKAGLSTESVADIASLQCDIRNEEQVSGLFKFTLSKFGRLDFLVNNGGGQFPCPVSQMSLNGWNAVVQTNLTGTFLMCREAHRAWMQENGGVIVNIIADMWRGFPMMGHTGAARSGVDNLTKTLAVEWAADGIRVNAVAPGSSIHSDTAAANYGDQKVFEKAKPGVPAKRLGTPEEISAAVCFLLSPAASFISGETLKVDAAGSLYSPLMWQIPEHSKLPAYKWNKADDDSFGKSKL